WRMVISYPETGNWLRTVGVCGPGPGAGGKRTAARGDSRPADGVPTSRHSLLSKYDLGFESWEVVRGAGVVLGRHVPVEPWGAVRARGRERVGQDHAAQHPGGERGADGRQRVDPEERAAGRAPAGP